MSARHSRRTATAVCYEYRIGETGELVDGQSLSERGADIETIPGSSRDKEFPRRWVHLRKTAGAEPVVDHLADRRRLPSGHSLGIGGEEALLSGPETWVTERT